MTRSVGKTSERYGLGLRLMSPVAIFFIVFEFCALVPVLCVCVLQFTIELAFVLLELSTFRFQDSFMLSCKQRFSVFVRLLGLCSLACVLPIPFFKQCKQVRVMLARCSCAELVLFRNMGNWCFPDRNTCDKKKKTPEKEEGNNFVQSGL